MVGIVVTTSPIWPVQLVSNMIARALVDNLDLESVEESGLSSVVLIRWI